MNSSVAHNLLRGYFGFLYCIQLGKKVHHPYFGVRSD